MQLQGTHTFKAPRAEVWDVLLDPQILSTALPGGEQLEKINDNEYKAVMNVRVGPVQGKFEGKIELADIVQPESYRMKVSGQGAPGFVNGEGVLHLEEMDAETVLQYTGDVQVGGKIAGVGQRLIESTAKSIIRQGFTALDAQIQARMEAKAAAAAVTAAVTPVAEAVANAATTGDAAVVATPSAPPALPKPAPTGPSATKIAAEVAKDVARDLASDMIPLNQQEKVFWFVLGAIAMLVLVILFRWIF